MAIYPYPGEPYRSTVLSYEWLITGLATSERVSERLMIPTDHPRRQPADQQ